MSSACSKQWPVGQIVSVPHALATKIMFWAVAPVSFRAAKIVSCNNKKNFMVYDQRAVARVSFGAAKMVSCNNKKSSWSTIKITSIVLL
jgi:hypothetical protein